MSAFTGKTWATSGEVTTVSWSFATAAGRLYDFSRYIIEMDWRDVIRDAFAAWESVADIDFVEKEDASSNNIRLGWGEIDGPNGRIGEASWQYKNNELIRAEIIFDDSETWTSEGKGSSMNLLVTAIHEIGHAIGLDHVEDSASIMHAFLGHQHGLTSEDIAHVQTLYGIPEETDGNEPNGANDGSDHRDTSETPLGSPPDWISRAEHIEVVAATYQFFTGSVPALSGFEYLIQSVDNETDLNDAYYAQFNTENLFLNFSSNLASLPEAEMFYLDYADLEFETFIAEVYNEVVGDEEAEAAGIVVADALEFFRQHRSFYEDVATERGIAEEYGLELATKVVATGSILYEATKSGVGHYAEAIDALQDDLTVLGFSAALGSDLFVAA